MMRALILSCILLTALRSEEVLSSHPVVVAPKRIEADSAPVAVRAMDSGETAIVINSARVILKLEFKPGSIRLSKETKKSLRSLGLKAGDKIRISGFGDATPAKSAKAKNSAVRLANLRARVVASFLAEYAGEVQAELQWNPRPAREFPGTGAVIERGE